MNGRYKLLLIPPPEVRPGAGDFSGTRNSITFAKFLNGTARAVRQDMKKLDWYILKKFLGTFFFSIILFTIISVVVDASEKTDDFVKSGLSTSEIFATYYVGFVPYIIALLFPLFVLIAVIFFTSRPVGSV